MSDIRTIEFWKRNASSVDKIESLRINAEAKNRFTLEANGISRTRTKEEKDALLEGLSKILSEDNESYRAFLYENTQNNFSLKFFLTIYYKNHTYYAIKGLYPFKQKNYKEIISLFSSYLP